MLDIEKIRNRMDFLELNRSQLAKKSGISAGYISDLLNRKRGKRTGLEITVKLAKALDVEPIFLSTQFANASKGDEDKQGGE